MPIVNADGCAIYVEVDGPERAPVLVLSNSLGTTLHMWDAQVAPFSRDFRVSALMQRTHISSGGGYGSRFRGGAGTTAS
jgi:3-oxoadipate enol-lactonase